VRLPGSGCHCRPDSHIASRLFPGRYLAHGIVHRVPDRTAGLILVTAHEIRHLDQWSRRQGRKPGDPAWPTERAAEQAANRVMLRFIRQRRELLAPLFQWSFPCLLTSQPFGLSLSASRGPPQTSFYGPGAVYRAPISRKDRRRQTERGARIGALPPGALPGAAFPSDPARVAALGGLPEVSKAGILLKRRWLSHRSLHFERQ
jgi:hypothetical protein